MNRGTPANGTNRGFRAALVDGSEVSDLGSISSAGEANDLLAAVGATATSDRWLILTPAGQPAPESTGSTPSVLPLLRSALDGHDHDHDPALIVVASAQPRSKADHSPAVSMTGLAAWLHQRVVTCRSGTLGGPTIAIRPDRILAVGGFDVRGAGLGFADLVTRLRDRGQVVTGAPIDPLVLQDLEPQLTVRERLGATADWYRHRGRRGDLNRFRRRVVAAVVLTRLRLRLRLRLPGQRKFRTAAIEDAPTTPGDQLSTLDLLQAVLDDSRQGWPAPRPDEVQRGVGHRADWRFLLPDQPVGHLFLAGTTGDGKATAPHFLEADGWASQVSRGSIDSDEQPPDVVVIGLDASVSAALANAAPSCTVVVELDRNPLGRLRRAKAVRDAGFRQTAQYLVTPNLERAKRYVSLDQPAAIGWLLAPPPPVAGTARGARRAAHRLLVRSISAVVARAASLPVVSAVAGSGAQGMIVARRGTAVWQQASAPPSVLMTSGYDEGSRAVLVSLEGDGSSRTVTKMSPRPRYNQNAEAEAAVIQAVRNQIDGSGHARAATLLPTIKPSVETGGLRGAQETYAGRWTATDLCNRVPASRQSVLVEVLTAIDRFSLATASETEPWSDHLFDRFVGDLLDQYQQQVGVSPTLTKFRAELERRSAELAGTAMPLVQRHYDLGPWNVVFADDASGLTIIDWELAPPRTLGQAGLGGADQLYFVKYWLHIALGTGSVDDELLAFEFLGGESQAAAAKALDESLTRLGVDRRFVPLLAGHVWLETALYTAARRAEHGGDPGSAVRYLETLAARRVELLQFWS